MTDDLDRDTVAVVFRITHGHRRGPKFFSSLDEAYAYRDLVIEQGDTPAVFTRPARPKPDRVLNIARGDVTGHLVQTGVIHGGLVLGMGAGR